MTVLTGKDALQQPFNFAINPDPALGANQLAMIAAIGALGDPAADGSGQGSALGFLRFIAASQAAVEEAAAGGATAQHQADQLTLLQAMATSLAALQVAATTQEQTLTSIQAAQAVFETHSDAVAGNALLSGIQAQLGLAASHQDETAQAAILASMQSSLSGLATHPDVVAGDASLAQIVAELQAALPLPSGAASASLQTAGNGSLASILAALAGVLKVTQPDAAGTGSIASAAVANATFQLATGGGEGVVGFRVSGLTAAGAALTVEVSNDGGVTWNSSGAIISGMGGFPSSLISADGQFRANVGGHNAVRLRVSTPGAATPINIAYVASSQNPMVLDPNNAPFGGAVAVPVGNPVSPGRSFVAVCTAAGNVQLSFPDGSSITVPLTVGYNSYPFAITGVVAAGTTATATYFNMR